ncbi:CYTH domain-containing protein [Bacillaceae bacterium W0354]
MQEIEIEFKNLLTLDEYDRLKNYWFQDQTPITQTNYYFETNDFQLKEKGLALRIRKKQNNYIATLKEPHEKGLLETHSILTETEFNNWINNHIIVKDHLKSRLQHFEIDPNSLQYKGRLTTHRLQAKKNGVTYVLDHSEYNNQEDFELELEVNDFSEGEKLFHSLLHKEQITRRAAKNKVQRFFESL